MDYKEIDQKNHNVIAEFLERTHNLEDDISGSVKATLAQFIMNFRREINIIARQKGQNWLSPVDIIESQVSQLRQCVIDLETYKQRLLQGVSRQ